MGRRRKDAPGINGSSVFGLADFGLANQMFCEANTQLASLIDSATTSLANELDLGLIKSIKQIVRLSDSNVHAAYDLLMLKLRQNHSQVRYLALLVMDELFTRSKLFRSLVVHDFETFMLHCVGYRTECPLPPPANRATLLKAKSMEILEKWDNAFGLHYKPLRLGYEYLKTTLQLQFPNLRQAAAQAEQRRKEREARSIALTQKKYNTLKEDFPGLFGDIQSTLKQLDECFEILNGANKQKNSAVYKSGSDLGGTISEIDTDDNGFEDFSSNSLRHILVQVGSKPSLPCETHDNKPVFDTVRDLCRLVVSQHIPATQEWMSILMRVETHDSESHDLLLRRVIDLRNELSLAKCKCAELGIDVQESKADDDENGENDIIWEVGEVDNGLVPRQEVPTHEQVSIGTENSDTAGKHQFASPQKALNCDGKGSVGQQSGSVRDQLLTEAPVLPWGSFLDRWGTEDAVPVNQRGLLLESHWGKVDYDVLLPADKYTEMSMRASYYASTHSEIPLCLAPLKNGGLCQRRDLRVCPLHGLVIPRDCHGNPILKAAESSSPTVQSASQIDSTCKMPETDERIKALVAKAVANVRSGGSQDRKLQAKRDREHNIAILRDAALANTSQGLGEVLGEDLERFKDQRTGSRQQSKRATTSLKAVLQHKPTPKDRLANRLFSVRVRDATVRQLTRDEDSAYREAFSNQWN